MPLDPARSCQVYAPASREFGSGYLVREGLVLTSQHVVAEAAGSLEVRLSGTAQYLPATPAWQDVDADAALLAVAGLSRPGEVRLGRLGGNERQACRAVGFPRTQARDDLRGTESIQGAVDRLTGREFKRLTVHVEGSVPIIADDWSGLSGAALVCGDLLVGILRDVPAGFTGGRLEAVPITRLAANAAFRELTGVAGPELLPAVEDEPMRHTLEPAYTSPRQLSEPLPLDQPSYLLSARNAVVPFRTEGREDDLAALSDWCAGDQRVRLTLITGPGGSGKTRLLAQLCEDHEPSGWVTGFLLPGADWSALDSVVSPLLLVLDDAESRREELGRLLVRLTSDDSRPAVRLVAIVRDEPEWWRQLAAELDDHPEAFDVAVHAGQRALSPLAEAVPDRQAVFQNAARAFSQATAQIPRAYPVPDLSTEPYDRVLWIHMAALTAVRERDEGGIRYIRQGARVDPQLLLDVTLTREAEIWEALRAEAPAIDDPVWVERAVAVACLTTARNEAEAANVLSAVPELAHEAQEPARRQLARWLSRVYPGRGWLPPLEPDELADALVAKVVAACPELVPNVLDRASPALTKACLQVLDRGALVHPAAAVALRDALTAGLESLWPSAVEIAQEFGDPIGVILAEVLAETGSDELAAEIADALPEHTVALLELANVSTERALASARERPSGVERDAEVSRWSNNLSNHLSALGRREEALAAIQEAVAIYRSLAAARPEAFRPDLASSLNNLSTCLSDFGRREEALAAIEEAVAIRRVLATDRPEAFGHRLASSLRNLSTCLSGLGRREEALAAIEEARAIDQQE